MKKENPPKRVCVSTCA